MVLHGVGATHHDFNGVHGPLSESFEVLSVDLPGHGESPSSRVQPTVAALSDAIEAHLDAVASAAVHVLGNSLGGRLALELAIRGRALFGGGSVPFGPAPLPNVSPRAQCCRARASS